ncbi:MAG: hypothetical protein WDZ94_01620 [Patescibacteria group bacterium]
MSRMLFLLLIGALVLGGGYTAYYYWQNDRFPTLASNPIEEVSGSVAGYSTDFETVSQTAGDQLTIFTNRAIEIGSHTRTVLSSAIQPNTADSEIANSGASDSASTTKPMHEAALEYGQYMYCKQVVESYENLQEKNN